DANETITLSTAPDRSKIASALQDLAAQYNAVAAKVNAQIGTNAGLLSGDPLIRTVQNDLRQLVQYQGSGTIQSLADLGIELSNTGQMSFHSDAFDALSDSNISSALSFLGSTSTGFGALAGKFTEVSDPIKGLIKIQQDQYDVTDQRLTDQINTLTERINVMQTSLSAKLEQADSLLAQLQSQQSILDSSIQALNYTVYGRKTDEN
ncbi:MAG TPA: flagellar filament capping protein FliD, partial [Bryobacteraceae bacterium]|nr:flagellar filament capping protein FliD [Bryobacteraceae bacterium]